MKRQLRGNHSEAVNAVEGSTAGLRELDLVAADLSVCRSNWHSLHPTTKHVMAGQELPLAYDRSTGTHSRLTIGRASSAMRR